MPLPHRALWLGLACALPWQLPAHAAEPRARSQEVLVELRQAIEPATCQADAQCKTIAIGAKACGGPAFYLPWSTQAGDPDKIRQLAQQYSKTRQEEIKAAGEISDCRLIVDPGAVCQVSTNTCTLRPRNASSTDPR